MPSCFLLNCASFVVCCGRNPEHSGTYCQSKGAGCTPCTCFAHISTNDFLHHSNRQFGHFVDHLRICSFRALFRSCPELCMYVCTSIFNVLMHALKNVYNMCSIIIYSKHTTLLRICILFLVEKLLLSQSEMGMVGKSFSISQNNSSCKSETK